jgi:hypothetical protein
MRKIVLAAVLVLMASGVQAVTLTVVGGQLHGASGVLVDGSLYDVQFLDGTCADFYSGCDDVGVSDFMFQTSVSAAFGAGALLEQVFLDGPLGNFESQPALTNGCHGGPGYCSLVTPYKLAIHEGHSADTGIYLTTRVISTRNATLWAPSWNRPNAVGGLNQWCLDAPGEACFIGDGNTTPHSHLSYAVWGASTVPEPSTALLLGIGLTGLAARGRRRS